MDYAKSMAKKNRIPYVMVERIYLGDHKTYLESTGNGSWRLVSPKAVLKVDKGQLYMSGNIIIDSPVEMKEDVTCKKSITAKTINKV